MNMDLIKKVLIFILSIIIVIILFVVFFYAAIAFIILWLAYLVYKSIKPLFTKTKEPVKEEDNDKIIIDMRE